MEFCVSSHLTRTVIDIYECTARESIPMITADGQRIPCVIKTVKVVCECGRVSLDEMLFADESDT